MSEVAIYALLDPETGEPRYVGKAINEHRRFTQHVFQASSFGTHKERWIAGLLARGLKPVLEVLQRVGESEWKAAERHYIAEFRRLGAKLTNLDDGGLGGCAPGYKESRLRYLKRRMSRMYTQALKQGEHELAARVAARLRAVYQRIPHIAPSHWADIGAT
jgi:hypothetical protein